MKCETVLEKLSLYLDKELAHTEREAIEEHLNECADCYAEFMALKDLVEQLSVLKEVTPPASLRREIYQQVASEVKKAGHFGDRLLNLKRALFLAPAVLTILLLIVFLPIFQPKEIEVLENLEQEFMPQMMAKMAVDNFAVVEKKKKQAELILKVPDQQEVLESLKEMLETKGGYVVEEDNRGVLSMRIPVSEYSDFLTEVGTWGEIDYSKTTVLDLSQEYQEVMKQREILDNKAARLAQLTDGIEQLALEKELTTTRLELVTLDSKLHSLEQEADLVSLDLELKPVFSLAHVQKVFGQALKNLLIGLVALLPFLAVLGIIGYLFCVLNKMR